MRLSDYDPEDPPTADHSYEADRLFGVAVGRGALLFAYVLLTGGELKYSVWSLWGKSWLVFGVGVALLLFTIWPLVQAMEHTHADLFGDDEVSER